MSGKFLLDTNALIDMLQGNSKIEDRKGSAGQFFVSEISEIELLCFPKITSKQEKTIREFRVIAYLCG